MHAISRLILERYQVRKSRKQKTAFINLICPEFQKAGYQVKIEGGRRSGPRNIVIGDITSAKYIATAHYDTCAVMPIPNFITPRNMVIFVMYQLLIVGVMMGCAVAAGFALWALTGEFLVGYLFMMVILALLTALMMVGPANRHTANDNTSGVLAVLESALALPVALRPHVAFVLFDLEEVGLLGSIAFRKKHDKELGDKIIVNLDCVSDGDSIHFALTRGAKKTQGLFDALQAAFIAPEGKSVHIEKGLFLYPSDQINFKKGVGVCALKKAPFIGYYMNRIHTPRDTVFDEQNIQLLQQGILRLAAM
jgi:hypothetical protein